MSIPMGGATEPLRILEKVASEVEGVRKLTPKEQKGVAVFLSVPKGEGVKKGRDLWPNLEIAVLSGDQKKHLCTDVFATATAFQKLLSVSAEQINGLKGEDKEKAVKQFWITHDYYSKMLVKKLCGEKEPVNTFLAVTMPAGDFTSSVLEVCGSVESRMEKMKKTQAFLRNGKDVLKISTLISAPIGLGAFMASAVILGGALGASLGIGAAVAAGFVAICGASFGLIVGIMFLVERIRCRSYREVIASLHALLSETDEQKKSFLFDKILGQLSPGEREKLQSSTLVNLPVGQT